MAQWSGGSPTLFAKLVYYGPALGGRPRTCARSTGSSIRRLTDEVQYTDMGVGTRVVLVKRRRPGRQGTP